MKGMRSFGRCQNRQNPRAHVLDRTLRVGEEPKYQDQELDLLQGATVLYPCLMHAGTGAPTARRGRRADARGKPASQMELVDVQCVRVARMCVPIVAISGCV
eukprot:9087071-Pyramimonas_sp.AAC.1